jgi:hypothetical protein
MANHKTHRDPISREARRRRRRAAAPRPKPPRPYDRRHELPRVLPLWPHELDHDTPEARRLILSKLRRALRAERRRGIAGHWTYDLCRHVELLRVYRLEKERIAKGE